jgi:sugar lactone lactonase YvrE
MKTLRINKFILPLTTALLFCIACGGIALGASAVKGKHIISVYNDKAEKDIRGLRHPSGVGCNDASLFIVADTGNERLVQYELRDGQVQSGEEFKPRQLSRPTKVLINSKGDIYTLDGKTRRIVRLSPDGAFMDYIEPRGLSSPDSYVPKSFALDMSDNIYILDIFSKRVLVLNPEAEYQKQIEFPEDYGYFSDVSVNFKGDILLLDSTKARVFSAGKHEASFTPLTESLREYLRFPVNVTTDSRGRIYLVDRNGSQIVVFGQDGSFLAYATGMGWKEGLLRYPSQVCLNGKGELFIADTDNNRVQIFQLIQ